MILLLPEGDLASRPVGDHAAPARRALARGQQDASAERFRAAVAYYPGCGIGPPALTAPTLILIGEADDWTPAEHCRDMVAQVRANSAPIELVVYPGAGHTNVEPFAQSPVFFARVRAWSTKYGLL